MKNKGKLANFILSNKIFSKCSAEEQLDILNELQSFEDMKMWLQTALKQIDRLEKENDELKKGLF